MQKAQRGTSAIAALAIVAVLIIAGFAYKAFAQEPGMEVAAQGSTGGAVSGMDMAADAGQTTQIQSQCKKGEVHTIQDASSLRETADGNVVTVTVPKEFIAKCYIPDPKDPTGTRMIQGPNYSDPVCAYKDVGKCVVRYCPPGTGGADPGCPIIKCADGAQECMQNALNSALHNTPTTAIMEFGQQGAVYQNPDGTSLTPKEALDPNLYESAWTQQKIYNNNETISGLENKLANCASGEMISSWSPCSESNIASWNEDRIRLEQENAALQDKLSQQMAALQQGSTIYNPSGWGTTGSGGTGNGSEDTYFKDYVSNPNNSPQDAFGYTTGSWGTTGSGGGYTAGDTVTKPYYCVTNIAPVVVQPVSVGSTFPSNCYNDSRSPQYQGGGPGTGPTGQNPCYGGPSYPNGGLGAGTPCASTFPTGGGGLLGGGTLGGGGGLFGGGGYGYPQQNNGLFYQMGYMLGNLLKGNNIFGNNSQNQYGSQTMQCATNQDQYNQQLQQYNSQIQQYNYTLQQYQYQQQQQGYLGYGGYGGPVYAGPYVPIGPGGAPPVGGSGYGMQQPPPPQPPQPCFNSQNPQQCSYSPQQPPAQSCSNGTWKPTSSGNGCIGGWQCVPGTTGGTGGIGQNGNPSGLAASISCEPKVADPGMTLAISFGCQNATGSSGSGFNTGNKTSGTATTTVGTPPSGTNTAVYTLSCTNGGQSVGAQCSVQVSKPYIVFVSSPAKVHSGEKAVIGWITSGMQSCVVSSPDSQQFTDANAQYKNTNGAVSTPALTSTGHFHLHCVSYGGNAADEDLVIEII